MRRLKGVFDLIFWIIFILLIIYSYSKIKYMLNLAENNTNNIVSTFNIRKTGFEDKKD